MADEIDRAQEREQLDRDAAIAATRERIRLAMLPRDPAVDTFCIDCNAEIPEARRKAVNTARCIDCAEILEKRLRGFAGA